MTEEQLEALAKLAAETLNGGNFYDENFYKCEHRQAWIRAVKLIIEQTKGTSDGSS